MGFQKKTGKGRIDKWYRLAKEKGYRARAAFKLIQLNRKYGFLERSRVILDLCAAPGSWCQVAAENMPANNSLLIGVDLAPIKPIPKAITIQSDITTDKCRASIRQHLKNWKADAVLHDGAPNVGTAWVQDAFSQAELVLQALKLATDFLTEGGVFVTKIFRSKDYNALLWIFNQLFSKVEATKPPSSRGVSAEIFVVCQGFKAPKSIDPRFLDPKSVFAEVKGQAPNNEAKVFNPDKKKRKREGYDEGDFTQFRDIAASEFVQSSDPIAILGSYNRLSFAQKGDADIALAALEKLPETTEEIRQCCKDLKVLGRKDFKSLLRWRLQAREIFGFSKPSETTEPTVPGEEIANITPLEVDAIGEELQQLSERNLARQKRERRRENEKKQKEVKRMQLHMITPSEIGMYLDDSAGDQKFFALKEVDRAGALDKITNGNMALPAHHEARPAERQREASETDEADDLDEELDTMYRQYQDRKAQNDPKYWSKRTRMEAESGEFEGFSEQGSVSGDDSDVWSDDLHVSETQEDTGEAHTLIFPRQDAPKDQAGLTRRAALFFEQDIFKGLAGDDEEESHDSAVDLSEDHGLAGTRALASANTITSNFKNHARSSGKGKTFSEHAKPNVIGVSPSEEDTHHSRIGVVKQQEPIGFEVVKSTATEWEKESEPQKDGRPDVEIITAEAMTLAHQVASGQKTRQDLVDDGFNKYTFRDTDGLPEWFLDDESKHSIPNRPVSAAAAAAIKEKLRALNARPIKKVREAKDRKKFKAAQKLEKLRKKSALMAEDDGISEKDKAANIAKLMKRATKKKPKQQPKLVVARGGNRGISGRPRGVKGKYKIVDSRLKKDVRAQKRIAKKR